MGLAAVPASVVAFAWSYNLAQSGSDWVHEIFWLGMALALAGTCSVVRFATNTRAAAIAMTAVIALVFSVPKFLRSPSYFNFYDELAHLRSTAGLMDGSGLWNTNPVTPAVAYYPGLHLVTGAVSRITGMSLFATGNLVVVLARVAGCLALYLLAERLLHRPRVAFVAVLVYAANPAFFFFDAQFAYESLALPLVIVVTALAGLQITSTDQPRWFLGFSLIIGIAVIVTHHASSYVLLGILLMFYAMSWLFSGAVAVDTRRSLGLLTLILGALALAWLVFVAPYTETYLGPYVKTNLLSLLDYFHGTRHTRALFSGLPVPVYEEIGSYVSIAASAVMFSWGARVLFRQSRAASHRPVVAALISLGLVYFLSLPVAWILADQVAKRTWEFAFIGLAPVAAAAISRSWASGRFGAVVAGLALSALFVGGAATRTGEHIRFPGPYLPSADPRSLTSNVFVAAQWLQRAHGSGNRVMGDRDIAAGFAAYGSQQPVTYDYFGFRDWTVFFPLTLDSSVINELDRSQTQYLAVDLRTSMFAPLTGWYFSPIEPFAYSGIAIPRQSLEKFVPPRFERVYDNGDVIIYQYLGHMRS